MVYILIFLQQYKFLIFMSYPISWRFFSSVKFLPISSFFLPSMFDILFSLW